MFYWHNTPIWPELSALGFKEIKATFQGFYIGKAICEAEINGVKMTLEMHQRTTCNDVQVSINGQTYYVVTYERRFGSVKAKTHKGAYKRILALINA